MVTRSRFSTVTVVDGKYLVPWLAAKGLLAYSPAEPPARGYFFQYTWILPGIFNPGINLGKHRYFGSSIKQRARFLFDFWESVRGDCGAAVQQARDLWRAAQGSYFLDPVVGVQKFGPRYALAKTSLSNIRITMFFTGESEVRIVDPSRISEVQGFGFEVEFSPTE